MPERRAAATATLLHLVLATETPDPATDDHWSNRNTFLAQQARVRAALMNGFNIVSLRRYGALTYQPAAKGCVTHACTDLEPHLITIAREVTSAEIGHVSRADYGNGAARHQSALQALLADPACANPPGETW